MGSCALTEKALDKSHYLVLWVECAFFTILPRTRSSISTSSVETGKGETMDSPYQGSKQYWKDRAIDKGFTYNHEQSDGSGGTGYGQYAGESHQQYQERWDDARGPSDPLKGRVSDYSGGPLRDRD